MLAIFCRSRFSAVAVMVSLALIASGCATGVNSFTQEGRVGPDNGSDACHAQAVALDNTGSFFGQDILAGAAIGAAGGGIIGALAGGNLRAALIGAAAGGALGAAGGYWQALQHKHEDEAALETTVSDNLTQENNQIDATQIAFNNDMDCRFQQAQTIRAQYAAGQITQAQAQMQMAQVQALAQRDLALAQRINSQIQSRGAQFDTAVGNLNGGTLPDNDQTTELSEPASIRRNTELLLQPDPSAPVIGQLTRRQPVTLNGTSNGYALVEADNGVRGFTPLSAVGQPGSSRPVYVRTASAAPAGSPVEQLDGSNAARRDAFAQSVSVSQTAVANGFQLST